MNTAFAYIYDEGLAEPRYEHSLAHIEAELARRGVEGHVARLGMFQNAKEIAKDFIRKGVRHIIVVGNDHTLGKMMWFLPDLDVPIGYIPVMAPFDVASALGIPAGPKAAEVMAGRLIEKLDVGKVNDRYFLTEVAVPASTARVRIEKTYTIQPMLGGAIAIRNLGAKPCEGRPCADPKDGRLEVIIQARMPNQGIGKWVKQAEITETKLFLCEASIEGDQPIEAFVDGQPMSGFKFDCSIVSHKLTFITGRERYRGL